MSNWRSASRRRTTVTLPSASRKTVPVEGRSAWRVTLVSEVRTRGWRLDSTSCTVRGWAVTGWLWGIVDER